MKLMTIYLSLSVAAPATYYRALACYDPQLQSPNQDASEELGFLENDIITVSAIMMVMT